ncbi:hypothetical protein [Polymorphospora sp. NPDC050346]|uniref:hypothetical protein n=1 Tax=Polymorphospora sp. NPDC050346 TaxID=3155780 RepID=UPI0033CCAFD6
MHPAKRGDLVVTKTAKRTLYDVGVVTSITREGRIKTVRKITGRDSRAPEPKPTRIDDIPPHARAVLPATQIRVPDVIATITARRTDPDTGHLPPYTSPVELLRDLNPWTTGGTDCLESNIRPVAYLHVKDSTDQRCGTCGVTTHGVSRIAFDADRCPVAYCDPTCPLGVNFATDYPIGLEVIVKGGYASGAIAQIIGVTDAYPSEIDGTRNWVFRRYTLELPFWGVRHICEADVEPTDPTLIARYAVRRDALTP